MNLYLELNEPGSGEVSIPANSPAAALLTEGQFIRAKYRGAIRGGFFVENIKKGIAGSGEAGDEIWSVKGGGALVVLDDAIVDDDGSGASTRGFSNMTKAAILIAMINEAKARGLLTNVNPDFTATQDSESVAWTDSETLDIPVGTSLLDLTRQFASTGIDFDMALQTNGTFTFQAFKNGKGDDLSNTIFFRVGVNCEEVTDTNLGTGIKNALLLKYRNGFARAVDSASVTAYRRREKIYNVESAQTPESASTFGAAVLSTVKDPQKSIQVKLYDGQGPRAFVDYNVGDYVTLDKKGVEESRRIRGIQLEWEGDDKFAHVTLTLNSTIIEQEIKWGRELDYLMNQWNTARDANLLEVRQWVALGMSVDDISRITTIFVDGDLIYFGGFFTKIGGIPRNSAVATYNMKTGEWKSLGGALSFFSTARGIAKFQNKIYVIGEFSNVWEWDPVTEDWSVVAIFDDFTSAYCIASDGTYLYVSGNQTTVDGVPLPGTIRWNGTTWSSANLGTCFSLIWDGVNFYGGGNTGVVKTSSDGVSWTQLGSTFGAAVNALASIDGKVIAGGAFTDYLAEWDGSAWTIIDGVDDVVRGMTNYLSDLYVAGDFPEGIKRYSGGYWYSLAGGINGEGYAVAIHGTTVIVGGDNITQAGTVSVVQLAAYFTNFSELADRLSTSGANYDLGAGIHGATAVATPLNADEFPLWKSSVQLLRKVTWANVKATLKTYFDTLYFALSNMLVGEDQIAVGNASSQLVGDDLLRWKLRGLRIGQNSSEFDFADVYPIAVVAKNADESIIAALLAYGNAGGGFPTASFRGYRARGTLDAFTAVQSGDYFWDERGLAHDGAGFFTGYQIRAKALENWSASARGSGAELLLIRPGETTRHVVFSFLGDGTFMPEILTADPASPAVDSMWLLRETSAGHADGEAMGPLGMTYTGDTGVVQPLQLSVNDGGTTRRVQFV